MAGDCFLIGLAPVLVHMSKVDGKFPFHPVSINLLVEVAKTLFATAVLCLYVRARALHSVLEALPAATQPKVVRFLGFSMFYGPAWPLQACLCDSAIHTPKLQAALAQ